LVLNKSLPPADFAYCTMHLYDHNYVAAHPGSLGSGAAKQWGALRRQPVHRASDDAIRD
jgi:hypothetical protein